MNGNLDNVNSFHSLGDNKDYEILMLAAVVHEAGMKYE